jgi:hypothetical protein
MLLLSKTYECLLLVVFEAVFALATPTRAEKFTIGIDFAGKKADATLLVHAASTGRAVAIRLAGGGADAIRVLGASFTSLGTLAA